MRAKSGLNERPLRADVTRAFRDVAENAKSRGLKHLKPCSEGNFSNADFARTIQDPIFLPLQLQRGAEESSTDEFRASFPSPPSLSLSFYDTSCRRIVPRSVLQIENNKLALSGFD